MKRKSYENEETLYQVLSEAGYNTVEALELYQHMFKFEEESTQSTQEKAAGVHKGNPVGFSQNWEYDSEGKLVLKDKPLKTTGEVKKVASTIDRKTDIMYRDVFAELLAVMQKKDFAIIGGVTYYGHRRIQEYAAKCYALIFDLDDVSDRNLSHFLFGATTAANLYPLPNYIVLSGSGIHLYYLLETPISLFPKTKIELTKLKYALTDLLWNKRTSGTDVQHQPIYQGYRIVGGKTKKGSDLPNTVAFKLNDHPFDIRALNSYLSDDDQIDIDVLFQAENRLTLAEAKELYPEWYAKMFNEDGTKKTRDENKPELLKGDTNYLKNRNAWDIPGKRKGNSEYSLYNWWKKQLMRGVRYHTRYFNIMCLAVYAIKDQVPYEQLEKDAYELIPYLQTLSDEDVFSADDVESALSAYDSQFHTFPLWCIEKLSGVTVKRNKRNHSELEYGTRQKVHMATMLTAKRVMKQLNSLKAPDGRPSKEKQVVTFIKTHPDLSISDISKALDISYPTVKKYYQSVHEPKQSNALKIKVYREENPEATKKDVAAALGLSLMTVYRNWKG